MKTYRRRLRINITLFKTLALDKVNRSKLDLIPVSKTTFGLVADLPLAHHPVVKHKVKATFIKAALSQVKRC